jgi:hypothetical protein
MNRVVSRLGFTTFALVAGTVAFAQSTSTTGAMNGVVTDASGAPVAGATVSAAGAQGTRTATTGADGSFRLGLMNPGEYQVSISKAGMATLKQKVTIQVNQNTPVNAKLSKEAEKVVEVIAAGASVDVTTTQQGLTTSMDSIASVPKGRDFNDVAFLTPGVVGSGFGQDPSIGGGSGAENQYIVDGLTTTDFRRGFQGAALKSDFIDQVEVQTGGLKPEFSALGGVINAVTKSGSNDLKGSAWVTWDARGIAAQFKENQFFRQAPANNRYDLGAEVGGPIIKDKLFFFAGLDVTREEVPSAAYTPNFDGLVNDQSKTDDLQFIGKLNWFITQDQQLTFSANVNSTKNTQANLYPIYGTAQFGGETKDSVQNFTLNYDWTITPSLFLSAKIGSTNLKTTFVPTDGADPLITDTEYFEVVNDQPSLYGTAYSRGGAGLYTSLDQNKTTQARVDLSWFLGSHNVKAGISQLTSKYTEEAQTSGGYRIRVRNLAAGTGGAGFNGIERQYNSTDATVKAIFNGMYIQDTWDINNSGFRLFYGFRFETQEQQSYTGQTFAKFDKFSDQVQPRIGFTWDVNNDGKTKVSGGIGRYFENIPQRVAIRVYANEIFLRQRFSSGITPGANNPNTGVPDNWTGTNFSYNSATGAYAITGAPNRQNDFAGPFSYDPIADGTKLPKRDEVTLGVDHTLENGWTVGMHAKMRKLTNPIEDSVILQSNGLPTDPGQGSRIGSHYLSSPSAASPEGAAFIFGTYGGQAILWNPHPGSVSWIARPTSGEDGTVISPTYGSKAWNVPSYGFTDEAGNTYQSVDITFKKKTNRYNIDLSYTWSRLFGNYEGVVSSSNGQADGNITASFDYWPYVGYGPLPLDRTNVAKAFGSYTMDLFGNDFTVGFRYTYLSGTPKSIFDDGSIEYGLAPGQATAGSYFHTTDVNTGIADGIPYDGFWTTNAAGAQVPFLDLGGYGNARPVAGKLGSNGRNPNLQTVDVRFDYTMKFGKNRLIPSVDIFNAFNSRTATGTVEQATNQNATVNTAFGAENGWLTGRNYRFGLKYQF